MILGIDTTTQPACIFLFDKKEIDRLEVTNHKDLSEKLLLEIDNFLSKNKVAKTVLEAIVVNPGPGSYTDIRIGVTVANLLAFSLGIPVYDNIKFKKNEAGTGFILPKYKSAPFITKQSRRRA